MAFTLKGHSPGDSVVIPQDAGLLSELSSKVVWLLVSFLDPLATPKTKN